MACGLFPRPDVPCGNSGARALLGGDTTRTAEVGGTHAPVTISITAMGSLPEGKGLTRAGAKPGDDIWVSGTVGDAYAALKHRWGHWQLMPDAAEALFPRMDRPTPRNMLGSALLDLATACADVSGRACWIWGILERRRLGRHSLGGRARLERAQGALPRRTAGGGTDRRRRLRARLHGPSLRRASHRAGGTFDKTRLTRSGKICEKSLGR